VRDYITIKVGKDVVFQGYSKVLDYNSLGFYISDCIREKVNHLRDSIQLSETNKGTTHLVIDIAVHRRP